MIAALLGLITAHPAIAGVAGMWCLGNAISALPTPNGNSGGFYVWFFKFMQPFGAAIPRLLAIYSPQTLVAITGQQAPKSNGNQPNGKE